MTLRSRLLFQCPSAVRDPSRRQRVDAAQPDDPETGEIHDGVLLQSSRTTRVARESHAAVVEGGRLVIVSGQQALDAQGQLWGQATSNVRQPEYSRM